ncbi:unnamed protein product, partial [Mesorhabditis belari]|uniref:Cyanovirin-N domain-containing protein n=1 Tax=Mesorhabditis belari TaxID=2138241 RepID=A0AAF3EJZ9_9BILA
MNRRLLATFLLLLSMISNSRCEKSCQTCAPLTPEECPLINECNICTETTFTRRQNRNGCQEVTISCASGSRVILELSNGHSVSRKAATLGSFSCQSNGRWQLNGLNYTEKNVKSASCYTASPDRQNSPINLVTQRAIRDLDLIDFNDQLRAQ